MDPVVHPYRIIRRIADGSSGTVYEAVHPGLQRSVALKVLHRHISSKAETVARFENEARVLARLEHPHVVRVHDVDVTAERPFIAMELVQGESLDLKLAREGRLPFDEVADIAEQILSVLEVAHAQNIIHRDLKPANLMLDAAHARPFVRVVDFGIALLQSPTDATRLTQAGQQLGTAAFMSPEQVSGEALDARSDLYSLACVLFELLSGRPPFVSEQPLHVLSAHLFREPPTLSEVNVVNVPRAFESVLRRALSKPRDARFSSAGEFRTALTASRTSHDEREVGFASAHEFVAAEVDAPAVHLSLDGAPETLAVALRDALSAVGARETSGDEPGGVVLVAGANETDALTRCAELLSKAPERLVLMCGSDDDLSFMAKAIGHGVFDYIPLPLDAHEAGRRTVRALRVAQDRQHR